MMRSHSLPLILLVISNAYLINSLVVRHDFQTGVKEYSYQTFTGVAMYSKKDAPATTPPGNGHSQIDFDLQVKRNTPKAARLNDQASIELIVIPDIHIKDIGVIKDNQLHLCCTQTLIDEKKCPEKNMNKLIIPKKVKGIHRSDIHFEDGVVDVRFVKSFKAEVTGIHVFAMASCDENLGEVTFTGTSVWMNPYGHLPGDVYGYLPFYGWMCLIYLVIGVIWFALNAFYWKELLHVQNCITGVLAILLIEMSTWYFHYLHLNQKGYIHHGPFVLGLITTVTRRMISRMLVVAVSLGYGVVKTTLGSVRNKIIVLGVFYWIFAFMFEALIHFNQTEKVETWMRSLLIPPVAIINGVFWWWTFVALNHTIEQLKVREQTAKLALYKQFTCVLVIALVAAIAFAIYEMYYVLKELYFAEWQRLWFMEVGFWQILFSAVFVTIMVFWRPSENAVKYATMTELKSTDHDDEDRNGPDTMDDYGNRSDSDENLRSRDGKTGGGGKDTARFMIGDDDGDGEAEDESKPKTTLVGTLIDIGVGDQMDEDTQLAARKMD